MEPYPLLARVGGFCFSTSPLWLGAIVSSIEVQLLMRNYVRTRLAMNLAGEVIIAYKRDTGGESVVGQNQFCEGGFHEECE